MKRCITRGALAAAVFALAMACEKKDDATAEPKIQGAAPPSAAPAEPKADAAKAKTNANQGSQAPKTAITKASFGKTADGPVDLYTLKNDKGLVMKVMNYGAIITEFDVPDKDGKMADIVGGFDKLEDYVEKNPYMGTTVGRIANRIKDGKFKLEGKQYTLATNNGPHHLHGGKKGWDKVIWLAEPKETPKGPSVEFSYTSNDGEEGFPGAVNAKLVYTLTNDNEFLVDMEATTDKTTIVNMAHHSYWNLGGQNSGSILDHELTINADDYTPGKVFYPKSDPVPNGVVKPVAGTPFDFTKPKLIGKDIEAAGGTPIGYDHNWVVNGDPHQMRLVAKVKHPASGRVMTVEANQPGVQFYAGTFLDGSLVGKGGVKYPQYAFFCLETQAYPNAINVPEWQNQVILKPGETYKHNMVHKFTIEGS